MKETEVIRVAAVQMDPQLAQLEANRQAVLSWLHRAAGDGADLVVFPECAISGYVFHDLGEARLAAEPIPGPTTAALTAACHELSVVATVGMLVAEGDAITNSAVTVGPEGLLGRYDKVHLPVLGVDRFARPGDTLDVLPVPLPGRQVVLGPAICYDLRFPETARILALKGAEVLVHPTNWPRPSADFPDFVTKAAARASGVFLISANRVGQERGTVFLGRSQIVPPSGRPLAEADDHSEMIISADLLLLQAHQKRVVHIPGEFELDSFGDRRPGLYGRLVEP